MAQTFFPITPTEITAGSESAWVVMDASGLIPVGATGVILHCVNTAITHKEIGLRKNGSTDDRHTDMTSTSHFWAMIGVDGNRYFQAWVERTDDIDIYVVGYTKSGVTFRTNAVDKSTGATFDWRSMDCSSEAPDAIGLIWEVAASSLVRQFGLRKNGSSDDRHFDTRFHSCFGAVIGCDGSQIIEGWREHLDILFYLVGYITDGCTFNTNADVVSLGSTGSYIDLSALPANADMGFIEVTGGASYGLRKNGESGGYYDIYTLSERHPWAIVECDSNQVIEGKIANLNVDFFVVGYSEVVVGWAGGDVLGVDIATVAKINGVALADIATFKGVA